MKLSYLSWVAVEVPQASPEREFVLPASSNMSFVPNSCEKYELSLWLPQIMQISRLGADHKEPVKYFMFF